MTAWFAIFVVSSLLGAAALAWLRINGAERGRRSLATYELRFPRQLEAAAVANLLAGITGLLPPRWHRWLARPVLVLEVHADAEGIRHRLLVPRSWEAVVVNWLQAALPSVRYDRLESTTRPAIQRAREYRLSTPDRLLRIVESDGAAKLLTSLQPLGINESIVVQWTLAPASPATPARTATSKDHEQLLLPDSVLEHTEAATALKLKQRAPLLLAVGRIGVTAGSSERARALLRQVEVTWQETRAPGVRFRRRLLPSVVVADRLSRRTLPWFEYPAVLNVDELVGLIGWPVGVAHVPGLHLSGYQLIPPSSLVPTTGTVLADSTFPGTPRPLALDVEARLRHLHVLGPTGTGKSTLLVNMVVQDIEAGHGVVLLDPKGDLVRDILGRIPKHRLGDVIVLDPADDEQPVGLNPLHADLGVNPEVVVENLVGLFRKLYSANWGPRTDDILRATLLTLVGTGRATLCEVPLLLTDKGVRHRIVSQLDDPVGLQAFFGWYDSLSASEQLNVIGPVLNKVRAFTMRKRVRGIIGQAEPRLRMSQVLAERKVLLVSLATGELGDEAAALLGALVVAELWHATTARIGLPPEARHPVMAYLDEWQHFLQLPTPMATVLAEARGLGLGVTLAHQYLSQLDEDAKAAVLSTVRSRVAFQMPATDAAELGRHLGGVLKADDLQSLGAFEVAAQLYAGGSTQAAATGRTRPLPAITSDAADLRERSRATYGVPSAEVEARLRRRHERANEAQAPIGRRPRRSA